MPEEAPDDAPDDERAFAFASAVYERLDEDPEAALELARTAPADLAADPLVRLATAECLAAALGEAEAREPLQRLVRDFPDDPDVRHALARVYEALGDHAAMVEQFLEVLRIDAEDDEELGFDLPGVSGEILELTKSVIEDLPEDFRKKLAHVPIVIEARPARDLVAQGFDPRMLGLFEGADHEEPVWEAAPAPPRIVLYASNLTTSVDPDDPDALAREVEITVLHEVGHYFGLDEERLSELGLG